MKTIGVLGGLGPQATMDFEARVHVVSQRLIPGRGNQGYPPMVVYYHRRTPVVTTEDRAPLRPLQLDPLLLDAARRLGEWVDLLVITSNGVHRLQREIEEARRAGAQAVSFGPHTMRIETAAVAAAAIILNAERVASESNIAPPRG